MNKSIKQGILYVLIGLPLCINGMNNGNHEQKYIFWSICRTLLSYRSNHVLARHAPHSLIESEKARFFRKIQPVIVAGIASPAQNHMPPILASYLLGHIDGEKARETCLAHLKKDYAEEDPTLAKYSMMLNETFHFNHQSWHPNEPTPTSGISRLLGKSSPNDSIVAIFNDCKTQGHGIYAYANMRTDMLKRFPEDSPSKTLLNQATDIYHSQGRNCLTTDPAFFNTVMHDLGISKPQNCYVIDINTEPTLKTALNLGMHIIPYDGEHASHVRAQMEAQDLLPHKHENGHKK